MLTHLTIDPVSVQILKKLGLWKFRFLCNDSEFIELFAAAWKSRLNSRLFGDQVLGFSRRSKCPPEVFPRSDRLRQNRFAIPSRAW
jgi:hypothetical protein